MRRFSVALALMLGVYAGVAKAANHIISTGVDYSPSTGLYTYHYAIDNHNSIGAINQFGILVLPIPAGSFSPLPHTSPPGWQFFTAFNVYGTYMYWYDPNGDVPVDAYLDGFSLTSDHPPQTPPTAFNYTDFGSGPPQVDEKGLVVGPWLIDVIPTLDGALEIILTLVIGLVGCLRLRGVLTA